MTACAHAPPAVFPAPDPAHMAQDIEKIREIAEAHRQEIEQCLRLSDPSLSWVGQATLFLPRSNSPPQEAQSRARWLSTLPTVVQSFDACIQSKAKNWGIPNQVTRPSLQLVLFLQANLSGPARSKPDLASRPLLSLQEGRVQLFYEAGFLSAPKLIAGKDPKYTGAGLLENVQGTIVAKCIIDTKGRVRNCRALKKLSRMNDATLNSLEARRYEPALWNGQPIETDYFFRVDFMQ